MQTNQSAVSAHDARKELELHLGAERVVVEEFTVAPWACVGAMPVSAAFIAVAALLNLAAGHSTTAEIGMVPAATAVAALSFSLAAILVYVLELKLACEWIREGGGKGAT